MGGVLNAGSEVSQLQLIVASVSAAILFLLVLRVYQRMRTDRGLRVAAERAALQAIKGAELAAGLALARTPAAAIEAAIQEPLHAMGAESGALFLVNSDG